MPSNVFCIVNETPVSIIVHEVGELGVEMATNLTLTDGSKFRFGFRGTVSVLLLTTGGAYNGS